MLFENTGVDEIHQLSGAVVGKACNLGERYCGRCLVGLLGDIAASDPVPLDRCARNEPGAAAVGLRVDLEFTSLYE